MILLPLNQTTGTPYGGTSVIFPINRRLSFPPSSMHRKCVRKPRQATPKETQTPPKKKIAQGLERVSQGFESSCKDMNLAAPHRFQKLGKGCAITQGFSGGSNEGLRLKFARSPDGHVDVGLEISLACF